MYFLSDDKLFEMIGLQELTGNWTLSTEVTSLLGVSAEIVNSVDIVKVNWDPPSENLSPAVC